MSDPKGILRNKGEGASSTPHTDKLDRQEVIKNTKLNAQLAQESMSKGDRIRAKIAQAKAEAGEDHQYPDHIAWDEVNLYKTEQERSATMKIDEPKTPYEKGFDPSGEYYQDDDEEAIPDFNLGEAAATEEEGTQSLGGGEVIKDDDAEEEEEEEEQSKPLSAEERHRKFEDMRKAHYHMKGAVLGQKIDISDDEE